MLEENKMNAQNMNLIERLKYNANINTFKRIFNHSPPTFSTPLSKIEFYIYRG